MDEIHPQCAIPCRCRLDQWAAFANADDTKWIAQCMLDNKEEGVGTDVVQKYCTCMNDTMSSDETQSIIQWEKTHPQEEKACSAQAGWK